MQERIPYYQLASDEALRNLKSRKEGLTEEEAAHRLQIFGANKLTAVKKEPLVLKLLAQFKDVLVLILIVAGTLALYVGGIRDAVILYSIVLVNAGISFVQEYKAEKVMESLKILVRARAKVVRGAKEMEIDGEEVAPGDIVALEAGDAVPADVRILEENSFSTNDFALTGESNPTKKFSHPIAGEVALGDRNNLAFLGTTVATGKALGVATATGMQTEIGRIAHLTHETETEPSPLQKEMNHLGKILAAVILAICGVLFAIGLFLHFTLRESFLFAMGIAAALVPEGLPAQVSIALSLAAARLAKKKAVVKKLSAVETLGATRIICTDKTGTLTQGDMTVQKLFAGEKTFEVTGGGYEPAGEILGEKKEPLSLEARQRLRLFLETGVFASNGRISPPDAEHRQWYSIGDPTEAALMALAQKAGIDPAALDKSFPEIKQFPFDAARKRMSSVRQMDGKAVVFVKGSPQELLGRCSRILDGTHERPMTGEDRARIRGKDDEFATQALRILGCAMREIFGDGSPLTMEEAETDLTWLGLVAMMDPPREEVPAAVTAATQAGIRVVIVTGDTTLTAKAIAKRIGLYGEGAREPLVVTGDELQRLSDIDLLDKIDAGNLIFARTSPEDKLRIVELLKRAGEIVAVTGDGVNDAPALKKADIGVAMGKTGTDVAKETAEIVLLDDSFATLVAAIREGRAIFQNLTKTILSSLTSNGGELFTVLLSAAGTALFGFPLAISAVQILAIDLVGEMLPLTFLTWDPPHREIMARPPRDPKRHIMNKKSFFDLAWTGFAMGALGYFNFLFLFFREGVPLINIAADNPFYLRGTTLTYISIVFIQWMNILSRRADPEPVATAYLWSNKRLIASFGISLFFLLNIVYNPAVSRLLHTAPLTALDWANALGAALIYLLIRETAKRFFSRERG